MYKRRGQRRYIVRLIKKERTENSAVWPPAIPYEVLSTPGKSKPQQTRWSATGGVLGGVFAMIGFSGQHTHSVAELVFYYVGAVLYGDLSAVRYGLGAVVSLALTWLAFRPGQPALAIYRWYFLLFAMVFGLIALNEAFSKNHLVLTFIKGVSIPAMLLIASAIVRLARVEKSKSTIHKQTEHKQTEAI